LDYAILQPGRLQDEPGTGRIEVAEDLERHETISREDVADAIIECLRNYLTIGKTIRMVSGELKIKDAIAQFVGGGNLLPIA
jgi:GTP cyclohydrolase III